MTSLLPTTPAPGRMHVNEPLTGCGLLALDERRKRGEIRFYSMAGVKGGGYLVTYEDFKEKPDEPTPETR